MKTAGNYEALDAAIVEVINAAGIGDKLSIAVRLRYDLKPSRETVQKRLAALARQGRIEKAHGRGWYRPNGGAL